MGIEVEQWRARIGTYTARRYCTRTRNCSSFKFSTNLWTTEETITTTPLPIYTGIIAMVFLWILFRFFGHWCKRSWCSQRSKPNCLSSYQIKSYCGTLAMFVCVSLITLTSTLILYSLALLLIVAGDVELNPGPGIDDALTLNDVTAVCERLYEAKEKWFDIGLQFNINYTTLSNMQNRFKSDPDKLLKEIVHHRLRSYPLTWRELCATLRSSSVHCHVLADKIELSFTEPKKMLKHKISQDFQAEQQLYGDTELTVSDLPIVLEKLFKARTKWYEIGLQLGVPNEFLRSLSVTNIGAEACLREMLADRLQTSAPLTWRDLCVSLRSPLVGHQDVAEEIEFSYKDFESTLPKRSKYDLQYDLSLTGKKQEDTELTITDLVTVYEKLYAARFKWFNIGLKLLLSVDVLHGIECNHCNEADMLRSMLEHRLKKTSLTWKELLNSLRSPIVGDYMTANMIEKSLAPAEDKYLSTSSSTKLPVKKLEEPSTKAPSFDSKSAYMEKPLTLSKLFEVTFQAREEWRTILSALGVKDKQLDEIGTKGKHNSSRCYYEGYKYWLKSGESNQSWRDVVDILSDPIVGHTALAKRIEKEFIGGLSSIKSTLGVKPETMDSGNLQIAKLSLPITNSLRHFYWKGYGLRLTIPENSLPPGVEKCTLFLSVWLNAPFEASKGCELLSALYNIKCEPEVIFKRKMTIEIQHCADSELASELSLVRASDTCKSAPEFIVLKHSAFLTNKCYGYTQVNHCSWYAIFRMFSSLLMRNTERRYSLMLFYKKQTAYDVDIVVAVCQDLEAQVSYISQCYVDNNFEKGPQRSVKIDNQIELEIEDTLSESWTVLSTTPHTLSKETIDHWSDHLSSPSPSGVIPTIQLKGTFVQPTVIPLRNLERKLKFHGVTGEDNWLKVFISHTTLSGVQVNKDYFQPDCSKAYDTMVKCAEGLSHAMSQDPSKLAEALFSNGLISRAILDETTVYNETAKAKGSRLYCNVLGVVKNFPRRYSDLVDILSRNKILYDDILAKLHQTYIS